MPTLRPIAFVSLFAAAAVAFAADPVAFTSAPKSERAGERRAVSFAVSRGTDVEVAVLGSDGKVVRHLAAGVLAGKNPAPAPLQPGLTQRLEWDGKDDLGNAAVGGPFTFRVRAGMSVKFGKMIGESAYTGSVVGMPYRAPVNGLVTDAAGNLLVKLMSNVGSHGNSGMWPWHLRLFDRNGQYVRTLLPYPPSTDPAKASGVSLVPTPDKSFTPANQTSLYPVFFTLGNEIVGRLADNHIVFIHSESRRINFLSLDGTNRLRTVSMFGEKAKVNCPTWLDIQVALSPDGQFAYYSNLAGVPYDGREPGQIDAQWPQGRIYRQDLTRAGAVAEPFFDLTLPDFEKTKYWMPSAWDKKTASAGIDTDASGNVYVCDLVNQLIVEIGPDGKRKSATKAPWPDRVMVCRKTGDLYVISRGVSRGALPPGKLIKIAGRGETARVVAELPLEGTVGGAMTVDETGAVPVLWLAGHGKGAGEGEKLLRVEDRGDRLAVTGDKFLNRDANAIAFLGYADVDPEAELVYVTRSGGTVWRFHGETGEGGPLALKAVDLSVGPGGHIYTWGVSGSYEGPLARFTRDLKPAPLPGAKDHTFGYVYGRAGRGSSVCGMDVDPRGRVFAVYGTNECHVRAYDEKGAPIDFPRRQKAGDGKNAKDAPAVITGVSGYGGSIRVDAAGNIYVLQQGVPKGFTPPPGFEKDEAYRNAVGTIYKFPPTGGEVDNSNGTIKAIRGYIATYAGCGPVSRWRAVGSCACTKPRFDLDGFGRLYMPDGIAFAVSIRDNADNEIVRFGGYGNFDCRGPGSREPSPEIPLGWPVTAGASDKHVYVGDCLNHRVVRVDKVFAATATAPVPR